MLVPLDHFPRSLRTPHPPIPPWPDPTGSGNAPNEISPSPNCRFPKENADEVLKHLHNGGAHPCIDEVLSTTDEVVYEDDDDNHYYHYDNYVYKEDSYWDDEFTALYADQFLEYENDIKEAKVTNTAYILPPTPAPTLTDMHLHNPSISSHNNKKIQKNNYMKSRSSSNN